MSTMKSMKAAQYDCNVGAVRVNDSPVPQIEHSNQILVRMISASLCQTDISMPRNPTGTDASLPITIGHEGVGQVTSLGTAVVGIARDDVVGFLYFRGACYECDGCLVHNRYCRSGQQQLQGFACDGFMAEYAVVDYQNAIVLPSTMDPRASAPLFCAGVTAFHAVDSCELSSGQWLAVVGCGGVGQYAIQYGKAMGLKILSLDVNDGALEEAKSLGSDLVINTSNTMEATRKALEATEGGVHAAAVFAGALPAFSTAIECLKLNGLLMVVGMPSKPIPLNTLDLIAGRYRIKGESTGIPQRLKKAIDFTAQYNIQSRVTQHSLTDVPRLFQQMKAGELHTKAVIVF